MRSRLSIFVALFLAAAAGAQAQEPAAKIKGPDYSLRGGEYAVLDNLRLHGVDKFEYVGRDRVDVYGKMREASVFLAKARVEVSASGPSACGLDKEPLESCRTMRPAEVKIYVGEDESGEIHDLMLRKVYEFWALNEVGSRKKAETAEHLNYKDGEYIMFQALYGPGSGRWGPRAKRLVWVGGKFYKFVFKQFTRDETFWDYGTFSFNTDEALEGFVGTGTYFTTSGNVRIQPRQMKGSFRKEFFRLYNQGAFNRVPKAGPGEAKPDDSARATAP